MIYVASKTKHAAMWRFYRKNFPIHSTWIDEAEPGQTKDRSELAWRCINEVERSHALILYCEPEDVLKGALIEVDAALANRIPVYCVGRCISLTDSSVFTAHPLWHDKPNVELALAAARRYIPCDKCGMVDC